MGKVHSIQTMGTLDGPGLRFVLFVQGCPLRCGFCHNPDTWDVHAGTEMSVQEIFPRILNGISYYKNGGVTVSGGEPLLQASFVRELFTLCKQNGIHTALDTSGCLWNDEIAKLLEVTDLCLLDIKMYRTEDYRRYIGCDLEQPLHFLQMLNERGIPTWLRQVVVQGIHDNSENISFLRELKSTHSCIEKIELLPFHKLCLEKYNSMNIPFPFDVYPPTPQEVTKQMELQL